jgi:hypothetical protein
VLTLWAHHLWVLWAHLTGWVLLVGLACGAALDRLSAGD